MPYSDICQSASGAPVRGAFSRLGPVNNFSDLLVQQGNTDKSIDLAAMQIVHLIDAWRYFSSSLFALMTNSPGNSLHLAYYAELRAAFSLFANSGMWFRRNQRTRKNYCSYVTSTGNVLHEQITQSSHVSYWGLWKEWINRSDAAELILTGISLPQKEVTLNEFISSLGGDQALSSLSTWGYDLLRPSEDRDARNKYSYQAHLATNSLSSMDISDVGFVQMVWKYLMTETGSQWNFDTAIIRHFLQSYIEVSKANLEDPDAFDDMDFDESEWLKRVVSGVSSSTGIMEEDIYNTLYNEDVDTTLFSIASEELTEPKNVIARALFMLRLATLAVHKNLQATPNKASVTNWIKYWADHAGLFSEDGDVSPLDLITDYEYCVYDFVPTGKLPHSLCGTQIDTEAMKLCRPDVCLTWNLLS